MMHLPAIGATFEDRYLVRSVLGQGGFATVFLATDTQAHRDVALKLLHPQEGHNQVERARFEREARILAKLRDPHTVTMFNFGTTAAGMLYLVTEYVAGEDLSTLLARRGTLTAPEVTHIVQQVLMSLRETHAHGLLHRDVKPGNIRITQTSDDPMHAKLLDFGIAKAASGEGGVTKTGNLVGTPRYMAPEQFLSTEVTAAADLYSLGVVAVEMLIGTAALHGRELADQVGRLQPTYVFPLPPDLDPGLAYVIRRLTAQPVHQRYPTAHAALEGFASPSLRPAPPTVVDAPRTPPPAPTQRGYFIAAAVVVGLIGLAVVVLAAAMREPEPAPPVQPQRQLPGILASQTAHAEEVTERSEVDAGDAGDDADALSTRRHRSEGCGTKAHTGLQTLPRRAATSVYVPRDYDPNHAVPLLLMVHESFEEASYFIKYSEMPRLADSHQFIIIAPSGKSPIAWATRGEVEALRDAVEIAKQSYCIDETRVYALGHATGGDPVERAMCDLTGIAAIATTSRRGPPDQAETACRVPVPYIHLAPLHDKYNPVAGGTGCAGTAKISLPDKEVLWQKINNCTGDRKISMKHQDSTCYAWDCEAPLTICHLDGGRGWPTAHKRVIDFGNCDGTPARFPYAETIWDFLSQHTLQ